MPRVIKHNYSRYYDVATDIDFPEVLDLRTGCKVAMAEVSDELAGHFAQREGFEVISDDEYAAITGDAAIATLPPASEPLQQAANEANSKPGKQSADPLANAPEPPQSA